MTSVCYGFGLTGGWALLEAQVGGALNQKTSQNSIFQRTDGAVWTALHLSRLRFACGIAVESPVRIDFSSANFTSKSHFQMSPFEMSP